MPFYLPNLFNHLWQSTVFGLAALLLALSLRHNRAQIRFLIWMAASVKFLIPFSLLVSIGQLVSLPVRPRLAAPVAAAAFQAAQPFAAYEFVANLPPISSPRFHAASIFAVIWALGFLSISIRWALRWRSVDRVARGAKPLDFGMPIPVLSSTMAMEPGVFGVLRPVLLLPEEIETRLSAEQMSAILAHELCHVRRRDNLTGFIHMTVEAIFWFHPLVWWIGARLVEERERACDEEVLRAGNTPEIYAEGILNVCKFCLQSPLPCVAGVTGSDLKKRIESIMTRTFSRQLTCTRKILLASVALFTIAGPIAVGVLHLPRIQAQQTKPLEFEVATIKPSDPNAKGRMINIQPGGVLKATNMTLKRLIAMSHHVLESQIIGGPGWIGTEPFDILAKPGQSSAAIDPRGMNDAQRLEFERQFQERLRSLLADRFQLKTKPETREMPVYILVVAKGGPKLTPAKGDEAGNQGIGMRRGILTATSADLEMMANVLANQVDKPVIDKTGIKGRFDFKLEWTPEPPSSANASGAKPEAPNPTELSGPSIFTALQEQLGLKLESQKASMPVLVIEHAEKPSAN